MDIEKFATTGYCSTGAGYIRNILKGKYPLQWEKIWMELNPKKYKIIIKMEKKEREKDKTETARYRKEERESLQWQKEEWQKMKRGCNEKERTIVKCVTCNKDFSQKNEHQYQCTPCQYRAMDGALKGII